MVSDLKTPAKWLLTARQIECAELAAKGMSSKEIARELNISPSTVDSHIALALVRYNLKKRSDLHPMFFAKEKSDINAKKNFSFIISNDQNSNIINNNQQDIFEIPIKIHNTSLRSKFYFIVSLAFVFWMLFIFTYFIIIF